MPIRAVVFDLDGTLIDSYAYGLSAVQEVTKVLSLPLPVDGELRRRWGLPWREIVRDLFPTADPERFHTAWKEYERQHPPHCPAYAGAVTAIRLLRERQKVLSLHTNRARGEALEERLVEAGFSPSLFHVICTPEGDIPPKPNRRSLEAVLEVLWTKYGVRRAETVCVVSDRADDVATALACGCKGVGVLTCAGELRDFQPLLPLGAVVVTAVDEVPDLIETW